MTLWFRPSNRRSKPRPLADARGWVPVVDPREIETAPLVAHGVRLFTAEAVIVGTVVGHGRLSDILNQRGEVRIEHASVRRTGDDPSAAACVRELQLDAFEVDVAMAGRLPDSAWTRARRVHKIPYPVRVDAGGYAIEGLVHMFPGHDPTGWARSAGSLFVPLTRALVRRDGWVISDPTVDAVLLNRHLVRGIEQADIVTSQDAAAVLERRILAPA